MRYGQAVCRHHPSGRAACTRRHHPLWRHRVCSLDHRGKARCAPRFPTLPPSHSQYSPLAAAAAVLPEPGLQCAARRCREREVASLDVRRRHGRAWSSGGDKDAGGGCGGRRGRCGGGPLPRRGCEIRQTRYVCWCAAAVPLRTFSSSVVPAAGRPAWPEQNQILRSVDRRALLGSLLLRCACVPFHSIDVVRGLVCGLQPRRWWPSRRRCVIPATFSGTGTSGPATTRATGAWSPAKRDKFRSCMFFLLILCIYGPLFLSCHGFHARHSGSAFVCTPVRRSMTNKNFSGTLSPAVGKLRTLRHL